MKPRSAIQKGKELENYVVDQIRIKGLDNNANRSAGSGSGDREKADIVTNLVMLGRSVGIECKNHKVPHMREWWSQVKKLEKLGREPVLVYKLGGEGMGDAKAVIYLDSLLDLIKLSNSANLEILEEKQEPIDKYKMKRAKDLIAQAINLLQKN